MLSRRIKELRKKRKMSMQELADRIPLSVSFLSDIENGRSNPSIKRLEEIAVALETTTAYLLEGDTISVGDFPEIYQADPIFTEIIDHLNGYNEWVTDDKEELLMYLRAKEVIRQDRKNQESKKS